MRGLGQAAVVAACLAGAGLLGGCGGGSDPATKASAERGHDLIVKNGCGSCHRIGGVERANGDVGPSLEKFQANPRIAGRLPNNPDEVVRWLLNPQAIDPTTVMPNLGLTPEQARDIANYLYTQ
ncbi:MAG: c-type cytochrome [Thermoleophilaceae bacterium]|jgi:mono/diheme cytochrome c family protein|nr:c-type cytochrome [Thermoleophilaceae bacterium]